MPADRAGTYPAMLGTKRMAPREEPLAQWGPGQSVDEVRTSHNCSTQNVLDPTGSPGKGQEGSRRALESLAWKPRSE